MEALARLEARESGFDCTPCVFTSGEERAESLVNSLKHTYAQREV